MLGISEVAARLDDRFNLLSGGHRTALPRHQTLLATLDWSHDLLPEPEQVVLRRLAVFAGAFTLTAASAVATGGQMAAADVVDGVANLVAKSLVRVDAGAGQTQYRLLETTRAYALEKLSASGEVDPTARRHAGYYLDLFERAEAEWETRPTADLLADYACHIDNVRVALDWALSPVGDALIGVALTAAAVPLWLHLSMLNECRVRVERALSSAEPTCPRDARLQMKLNAALGLSLMQLEGPRLADALWTKALGLAESVDDTEYQLRALWGLWSCRLSAGDYDTTVPLAQRFRDLAVRSADPADRLIGDRMMGLLLHHRGDQAQAHDYVGRGLDRDVTPARRSHNLRFQYDHRVKASVTFARVLWLQGFPDRAVEAARRSADQVRAIDHPLSLCRALADAVFPTALFLGDLSMAERTVAMLLDESARYGLPVYHLRGQCLQGALEIKRGDAVGGLRRIRAALDELRRTGFRGYMVLTFTIVEGLVATGQLRQATAMIDEALEQAERTEERWCVAEQLRIKGELLLMEGAEPAATAAEECFLQALDVARRQSALSWELRAATSLARLWRDRGWTKEARELLSPVYDRFTEGFETTDLKAAKSLVDDLRAR